MQNSNSAPYQTDLLSELFGEIRQDDFKSELDGETDWMMIYIDPMPTPRPRARSMTTWKDGKPLTGSQIYNPTKYTVWKKELASHVAIMDFNEDEYNAIDLILGVSLKKSYTKKEKERLVFSLHDKTPDFDNYAKGVLDAIQQSGKILNDSKLGSGMIEKVWIPEGDPEFIVFKLLKVMNTRFDLRKIITNSVKYYKK
jgi:Holliday junction resolvase RusA-like endonuclease